jgi:hypothetical protein
MGLQDADLDAGHAVIDCVIPLLQLRQFEM